MLLVATVPHDRAHFWGVVGRLVQNARGRIRGVGDTSQHVPFSVRECLRRKWILTSVRRPEQVLVVGRVSWSGFDSRRRQEICLWCYLTQGFENGRGVLCGDCSSSQIQEMYKRVPECLTALFRRERFSCAGTLVKG